MISKSPAAEIVPSIERGPQRLNEIDEEGGGEPVKEMMREEYYSFFLLLPFWYCVEK